MVLPVHVGEATGRRVRTLSPGTAEALYHEVGGESPVNDPQAGPGIPPAGAVVNVVHAVIDSFLRQSSPCHPGAHAHFIHFLSLVSRVRVHRYPHHRAGT
ncbi:MAG TPA: hypothetical protein VKX16_13200 [Chloroflexota bacterium]|nr:hypothetical protein [Chloroflexota bacterium]